jgi:hypothetical protein
MLFRRVWYPAGLCSAGCLIRHRILFCGGLIPLRILFCGVSDPAGKLRPRRTRRKGFESLPFSLKGHFLKIICMYKLLYPRHKGSMLKEPATWNFFFSAGYQTPQNNLEIWIPPRIWTRIWKCFRVWIRGPYGLDSWKNQTPKISCYCFFNKISFLLNDRRWVT